MSRDIKYIGMDVHKEPYSEWHCRTIHSPARRAIVVQDERSALATALQSRRPELDTTRLKERIDAAKAAIRKRELELQSSSASRP